MITKSDVEKIAVLAKLRLDEEEKNRVAGELDQILKYVEKLDELDLKKVDATSHAVEVTNVFREDETAKSSVRDKVLANSPKSDGGFFTVPRILGDR